MTIYIRGPWKDGSPSQRRYEILERPPSYVPAHRARGWNGHAETWKEPASVHCGNGVYHPKHGRVDSIRVVDDGHPLAQELARISAERERLHDALLRIRRVEQDAIRNAWTLLPSVRVADLKRQREERLAAKEAKK